MDHFVPGIGVDLSTSGGTARMGLTYYFCPTPNCTAVTCQLDVGFISSVNGGTSWSTATQVAGPMSLSWIPNTSQGHMLGDYISTSIRNGLVLTGGTNPIAAGPQTPNVFTVNGV